jgi:phosphoribosylpyrophosphate synthetase
MRPVVLYLPWGERLGRPLGEALDAAHATLWMHRFPDGEARVRIDGDLAGRSAIMVASLDRPDAKLLPLLFALATARDLGARSVGLVAPYLPYMRQDLEFHRGEGMSARHFAELLSRAADWVLTVDPHLHRIHRLDELFTVPVEVAHSAPAIAEWIRAQVAATRDRPRRGRASVGRGGGACGGAHPGRCWRSTAGATARWSCGFPISGRPTAGSRSWWTTSSPPAPPCGRQ